MLNKFDLANIKRLEQCMSPVRRRIDIKKRKLAQYVTEATLEIQQLEADIAKFQQTIDQIKSKESGVEVVVEAIRANNAIQEEAANFIDDVFGATEEEK
jgi:chromosome segregation ATPase